MPNAANGVIFALGSCFAFVGRCVGLVAVLIGAVGVDEGESDSDSGTRLSGVCSFELPDPSATIDL